MIKRLKKLKRNELKIRGNRVNELKIEELERNIKIEGYNINIIFNTFNI